MVTAAGRQFFRRRAGRGVVVPVTLPCESDSSASIVTPVDLSNRMMINMDASATNGTATTAIIKGRAGYSLKARCDELHRKIGEFLKSDAKTEVLRKVQRQTETSVQVIDDALQRYSSCPRPLPILYLAPFLFSPPVSNGQEIG